MDRSLKSLLSPLLRLANRIPYKAKALQQRLYRIPEPEAAHWSPLFQWFVTVFAIVLLALFLYVGIRILWDALMFVLPWGEYHAKSADVAWPELRNRMFIVAALLGAPFLVWRTVISSKQTQINQDNHYTSLFTKAVELLGSTKNAPDPDHESQVPNVELRVGAIYSLERISLDSERDYWPIIETVTSYARANGDAVDSEDPPCLSRMDELETLDQYINELRRWKKELDSYGALNVEPKADIQAALRVIGRRSSHYRRTESLSRGKTPDLSSLNAEGARLRHLDFGCVFFSEANLSRAQFHLTDLSWSWFDHAQLVCANFFRAGLSRAEFMRANLRGSWLSAAVLEDAEFNDASLEATNMGSVRAKNAVFAGACLDGCSCNHADFTGASFTDASLVFIHATSANFGAGNFIGADLRRAQLAWANLDRATLNWCNLMGSDLHAASLREADLEGAVLSECILFGADLTDAKGVDQELLNETLGDRSTIVPSGLVRPESWHNGILEEQIHGQRRVFVDKETKERYYPFGR